MNLSNVEAWSIPEGSVEKVSVNGVTVWEKQTPAPALNYFYFEALMNGATVVLKQFGSPNPVSLEYSYNGNTWMPVTVGEIITVGTAGRRVYIRGNNATFNSRNSYHYFDVRQMKCGGSIMTLLDKTDTLRVVPAYAFASLFRNTFITTPPELPATTVGDFGYSMMFSGCGYLTTAPELPATSLGQAAYHYMFEDCRSIREAPELPAEISEMCYYGMFTGCTGITEAPYLPAEYTQRDSYREMFNGCSALSSVSVGLRSWFGDTTSWLDGVAATGTFTCPAELPDVRGVNNIPAGWTRVTT